MISWFLGTRIGGWAIAIVAVLAVVGIAILRVFSAGKEAARNQGLRQQLDNVRIRDEVATDIARGDDAERQRVRAKWTRR